MNKLCQKKVSNDYLLASVPNVLRLLSKKDDLGHRQTDSRLNPNRNSVDERKTLLKDAF